VLTVSNLTKSFGSHRAVDDVSFSVSAGEILGLLGPNGAGKTTVIRMVMGILSPDAGTILFTLNGTPGPLDKTRVGYLPEERGLYDDARVLDILVYLATLKGRSPQAARRDALEWLERLDLAGYAHQKLEKLSRGMQQKVQFVAAILHRPDLVMLDEPFTALDPVNQELFKDIIRELQREGRAVLLSSHQMNLVEELCDSIFMMHRGRKVLHGSLQDIKDGFKESIVDIRYRRGGDISFLEQLPGVKLIRTEPERVVLRYSGPEASQFLGQVSARVGIREISLMKPPLHEIFVQAVRERGEEVEPNRLA
jgi:ABC-2 type transport system ATP-binding protein